MRGRGGLFSLGPERPLPASFCSRKRPGAAVQNLAVEDRYAGITAARRHIAIYRSLTYSSHLSIDAYVHFASLAPVVSTMLFVLYPPSPNIFTPVLRSVGAGRRCWGVPGEPLQALGQAKHALEGQAELNRGITEDCWPSIPAAWVMLAIEGLHGARPSRNLGV